MTTRPAFTFRPLLTAFALAMVSVLILIPTRPAQAQTFTVLHNFTGGADGGSPFGSLVMDRFSNIYGVATYGGNSCPGEPYNSGCGVVFKMEQHGSEWIFLPVYAFTGSDGANPVGAVTVAPDGSLYGATDAGGLGSCNDWGTGCGTVYHLRPSPTWCHEVWCAWNNTVLYSFTGGVDGGSSWGGVALDSAGNIYGTTYRGGSGHGVAYAVTHSQSGWTESVIHNFTAGSDGTWPASSLISDSSGNFYGTTEFGGDNQFCGSGCGTVFKLSPSGSGWNESVLYAFQGGSDGAVPQASVVFDSAGNLYGTNLGGALNVAFELSPSSGNWLLTPLYGFQFGGLEALRSPLTLDSAGNLYGVTEFGGISSGNCPYGCGTVFKLAPTASGWSYTTLHEFDFSDGFEPYGGVVVDSEGNIYGTASGGGPNSNRACELGCGVVWKITQ
jgi:uncharacterized repeat protein (TIGR03803 family)